MTYNRISADCHLDLIWLPPDLFVSEAPGALKDRMPYVADGPEGPRWIANNGAAFGLAGGVGASGTKHVPGKQLRVDVMAATGLYEDGRERHSPAGRPASAREGDGSRRRRCRGHLRDPRRGGEAERSRSLQRDAPHLQHVDERVLPPLSRPPHRPRLPPLRGHRRGGGRGASRRQARLQGDRALLLMGHGPDVASDLG